MEIRHVRESDFDQVARLRHRLWELHAVHSALISKQTLAEADAATELHDSMLARRSVVFVAADENLVAGYAKADLRNSESWLKHRQHLWLDEVFVDPAYRRLGLATELVQRTFSWSADHGCDIVRARIYPFSSEMKRLFINLGGWEFHTEFALAVSDKKKP